jgi:hypothetical protein
MPAVLLTTGTLQDGVEKHIPEFPFIFHHILHAVSSLEPSLAYLYVP